MVKVFIDGSAGTTGLRINERLADRDDISIIKIDDEHRKDPEYRKKALNSADIVFLCLPDDAAREAVSFIEDPNVAVIDTSTAHRTDPAWAYGFPELEGQREKIKNSKRIANPGCHASGFVALIAPLVKAGVLKKDVKLTAHSITGYTGGGKKMIAEYEGEGRAALLDSPRQYGLTQKHKHLPEMKVMCGIENEPVFCPIVADYPCGMEVTVPLFASDVFGGIEAIKSVYRSVYSEGLVRFEENSDESGFLASNILSGYDDMQISVFGNDERIILVSRFDNLGKGASGAAIQNMNIIMGKDEATGLNVR